MLRPGSPATLTFNDLTLSLGSEPVREKPLACRLYRACSMRGSWTPAEGFAASDFHAPVSGEAATDLFIEANFEFEETADTQPSAAVPTTRTTCV